MHIASVVTLGAKRDAVVDVESLRRKLSIGPNVVCVQSTPGVVAAHLAGVLVAAFHRCRPIADRCPGAVAFASTLPVRVLGPEKPWLPHAGVSGAEFAFRFFASGFARFSGGKLASIFSVSREVSSGVADTGPARFLANRHNHSAAATRAWDRDNPSDALVMSSQKSLIFACWRAVVAVGSGGASCLAAASALAESVASWVDLRVGLVLSVIPDEPFRLTLHPAVRAGSYIGDWRELTAPALAKHVIFYHV